jgi:hypothetical protein
MFPFSSDFQYTSLPVYSGLINGDLNIYNPITGHIIIQFSLYRIYSSIENIYFKAI